MVRMSFKVRVLTGHSMVHILAAGVFFSGFVKDLLCLPRPLSPPLQRITMSGSAALEYGFPSTHSTNAVSVAVYALFILNHGDPSISASANLTLQILCYFYAFTIVIGRLYCGMHGFFDVIIGSALGAGLALIQCIYGEAFDLYVQHGTFIEVLIVIISILVLVRVHPEPADDCPCFDDSVAFAGVVIGVEAGCWHFGNTQYGTSDPFPATVPFDLVKIGWTRTILRIVLGVVVIFAWREVMKPTLLRGLPPLFRVIEKHGLSLPRKFFLESSKYTQVPRLLKDDNVIPSMSEIPTFLSNIRHPRRRAVSVGPQSEADAYETLAYREKRRKDSLSSPSPASQPTQGTSNYFSGQSTGANLGHKADGHLKPSKLDLYEGMMGTGFESPAATPTLTEPQSPVEGSTEEIERTVEEKEMFSRVQRPRVRYDVEVVTKLIVYSGIAWLAVEGNPILFQVIGLGI